MKWPLRGRVMGLHRLRKKGSLRNTELLSRKSLGGARTKNGDHCVEAV